MSLTDIMEKVANIMSKADKIVKAVIEIERYKEYND